MLVCLLFIICLEKIGRLESFRYSMCSVAVYCLKLFHMPQYELVSLVFSGFRVWWLEICIVHKKRCNQRLGYPGSVASGQEPLAQRTWWFQRAQVLILNSSHRCATFNFCCKTSSCFTLEPGAQSNTLSKPESISANGIGIGSSVWKFDDQRG